MWRTGDHGGAVAPARPNEQAGVERRTAPRVAIVGMGFSGVSTAVQLLESLPGGTALELFDDAPQPARGLAYGTRSSAHLMNVRAARLGLAPDREGDFLAWLQGQNDPVAGHEFVPRQRYGDYLQARLADAIQRRPDIVVNLRRQRVLGLSGEVGRGFVLHLGEGATQACDQVVLALGHAPMAPPHPDLAACARGHYVHRPFAAPGASDGLTGDEAVLLLGSGLTAIDMLAELVERGHRGPIHMLSRHGLLPQAHLEGAPIHVLHAPQAATWAADEGPPSVRRLLARWRAELRTASEQGHDWRDLFAAIREATPALWQALPLAERRRFLRHLARYWDVHRHGCPPRSQGVVDALRASGQLHCAEGRLISVREHGGELHVEWRPRRATEAQKLVVQRIVNCTGASTTRDLGAWPLLDAIGRQQGLLRCPLDLGVLVDAQGRLLDAFARPLAGLYYVGPLLKAQHWEAVAVPELRQHAAQVARHVAAVLAG